MRQTIRIIFAILIFSVFIFLWKNEYLIPFASLIAYVFVIGDFLFERSKLRTGKYISVGKVNYDKSRRLFLFISGFFIILWGVFDKHSSVSFRGIDSKVFSGVFFMLLAALEIKSYLFLLTENAVIFDGFIGQEVWRYKKLDKVLIRDNEIRFIKAKETQTFPIGEVDQGRLKKIGDLLSPKLNERLIIEEAPCTINDITNGGL
jgi:hypothetical protein